MNPIKAHTFMMDEGTKKLETTHIFVGFSLIYSLTTCPKKAIF